MYHTPHSSILWRWWSSPLSPPLRARPDFFKEATQIECPTFNVLVSEFRKHGLLEDGRSLITSNWADTYMKFFRDCLVDKFWSQCKSYLKAQGS
ncbi:hypothetical protein VP01_125g7 [Puccinia sorghi]|uniref:Uncharacterized protein n=1 Tax=Puccinia sorghi TaxID=27349 RepID=A0A0L6VPH6_9BASI|nr:hypothetical protein VP01_125g7 [Puccinia sorghi]